MNVVTPRTCRFRSSNRLVLQQVWPRLAQSNPILLHAMIAVSAAAHAARNGELIQLDSQHHIKEKRLGPNAIDSVLHQAEVTRLFNMRLSDPAEASSDAMLAVSTLLVAYEVSRRLLCLSSKTLLPQVFAVLNGTMRPRQASARHTFSTRRNFSHQHTSQAILRG